MKYIKIEEITNNKDRNDFIRSQHAIYEEKRKNEQVLFKLK